MKKINAKVLIIDDDKFTEEDPLVIELREVFEEVLVRDTPDSGLQSIKDNLEKKLIVLLDLAFPLNQLDGHEILEKIREFSYTLPVIIFSGKDEDKEIFADLINNRSFAFLKKTASSEEIVKKVKEAAEFQQGDISVALEEWINVHSEEQKHKPYMFTLEGQSYSLNNILKEIRLQSATGKHFSKNITKLTIDLLTRNIESLDD